MIGLKIGIGIFVLVWICIIRELRKAPLIKEDENIVNFDEDEEFLG
jgi:hypothetical protein